MGGLLRQYSWILNLLAIFLCSFFLAKIVGAYVGTVLQVKRSVAVFSSERSKVFQPERKLLEEYQIIIDRNIFDSTNQVSEDQTADSDADEDAEIIEGGEAVLTKLSITVIGVLVVGEGRDNRSSATISSGSKSIDVYSVRGDESFAPNTTLTLVAPDRIEFLNNGRLEYAEVGEGDGTNIFASPSAVAQAGAEEKDVSPQTPAGGDFAVKQEAAGKFVIDQKEVENALQNLDKLYTEIRAVPNFSGGKVAGMKILSVKNGSLFSKIGLRRGDVLQRINGLELDVKQGFAIFNQLKDAKSLTVDLIRQGQAQTIDYEIR
ncbi:MAG: hypothetical protein COX62_02250 [Deltaproteobacteria bacterium CG_4_10_14_0_2_um_filter_43_8]|nr:MAG: hypothetical protein COV43_01850 [Deltaproteobacteria bacterium CG11_big_fil_rev_8_21_14_0_20_42_23]PJA21540.1 MAG: hypothetical protein COX62_02250 [Deltaproteobacteria bacterium CG_4_10_14_0_2_um_filter_43_8]PJC63978.1 MAG: hypothetical protein CO021_06615 [Deltaproteobacteria bacterium CG_4_9_14_0_2_um_filter_42_21]